jgi:hypothetical protein
MEIKEIKTEKEIQIPQKPEQDYIEVDLDVLIKAGVIEREVEVVGIKFTLRTLTEEERRKVEELTNDGLPIDDPKHVLNSKVPMLSFAITKINGKPIPPEKRPQLMNTLYKMQSYVLDQLFIKYMEIVSDQMALTEQSVKRGR